MSTAGLVLSDNAVILIFTAMEAGVPWVKDVMEDKELRVESYAS